MSKAVLICILLITLLTVACEETKTSNQAKNTASPVNVSTNKANSANVSVQSSPEEVAVGHLNLPQDPLMENLSDAIYKWSPEQEYALHTELKNIWVKAGNHPWEYSGKGARKLIARIQVNSFFKNCPQAKELNTKMFEPTGEIQTVGKLYDELYFCNPDNK